MDLLRRFPEFTFKESEFFIWSPEERVIFYDPGRVETEPGKMMLLHELGHALLGHEGADDEGRYAMERDAWEVARVLAQKLGIRVDEMVIVRSLQGLRKLGY